MISVENLKDISTERAELTILKTLAYFDIFEYPLSEKEMRNFLGSSLPDKTFSAALQNMVTQKTIFKVAEFYSLHDNLARAERRVLGNVRAERLLVKARKIGSFLYGFPYVRAVAVSGSLSKGYAEEKADIDFFIITKASRLWIARTLLHLFKKLTFLTGRQDLYCMNYFIDEQALLIPERNIFTATEIVTLLPVAGPSIFNEFSSANKWVGAWLPEHAPSRSSKRITEKNSFFKRIAESLFNNRLGNQLDDGLHKWTTRRWQKKEKRHQKNSKGRVMNLLTGKHFAKSDPESFQKKIVELYEEKLKQLKINAV
jgi:hypothetical protein